jgi:DisA bacterial checkpoint controller nucleotide-binding
MAPLVLLAVLTVSGVDASRRPQPAQDRAPLFSSSADLVVEQIDLPLGLGSRHLAAASISQRLGAIAIVVSESGVVRVFHRGEIEATLIPELWLLDRSLAVWKC